MVWVGREQNQVPTLYLHGLGCCPLDSLAQDLIHLGLEHIQGWKWDPTSPLRHCSHALSSPNWPHWHNNVVAFCMSQVYQPAHHLLSAGEEAGMYSWRWRGRQNPPWWQLCRLNNFKVICEPPKWAVWAGVSLQWLVPLSSGSELCSVGWGLLLVLHAADAEWLCLLLHEPSCQLWSCGNFSTARKGASPQWGMWSCHASNIS